MDDWDTFIKGGAETPPTISPPPAGDDWDTFIKGTSPSQAAESAIASPAGKQLEQELRAKVDRELLAKQNVGQGYAALSSFANMLGLNVPRNVAAGVRTLQTGNPFGEEYNYAKAVDEAAARQFPKTTAAGTVAGALGLGAALPVAGPASLGARALLGAGTGAALGGLSEFAESKSPEQALQSAALGGAVGGVAGPIAEKLVTGPVNLVGKALAKKPVIPSTADLEAASQAAYRTSEKAGVVVNKEGIRGIAQDIKASLADEAYHPKNQPKLSNFLNELESLSVSRGVPGQPPNIGVTLKGLDTTRKMLRSARASGDAEEARMARIAADKFDNYLSNLKPSEVAAGLSKEGVTALEEARSLWSSYRKADLVDEALQAAKDRTATSGAGGNMDNVIRQEFRKILQSKKKSAAFTDKEKAALAQIVTGTKGQNTLRLLGKLSPTGDGLRLLLSTGAAMSSGGATLPLNVLGAGAKALADRATPKNVEALSKLIRARGLNITPEDVIKERGRERLQNFFTSLGIDAAKMAENESSQ